MTALVNPVSGERITFRDVTPDLLRVEIVALPGRAVPPAHVHPRAAERFTVIEGALRITTGGSARTLRAGDDVTADPGSAHAYAVAGDEPARFSVELAPPGGMGAFLERVYRLAEEGRVDRRGQPRLLDAARLFAAHGDDIVLPVVPRPVQRVLWSALARVAR